MISNERLSILCENFIDYIDESLGRSSEELYDVLVNAIGMTDNEIDQLAGNFDADREGFDNEEEES